MAYDNLDYYFRVPTADIGERWASYEAGTAPMPWQQPPQCGARVLHRLVVLTVADRLYEIPYSEFYRVVLRGHLIKIMFENGVEETVLEFYGSEQPRSHTGKEPFGWIKRYTTPTAVPDVPKDNVLPFKPKRP